MVGLEEVEAVIETNGIKMQNSLLLLLLVVVVHNASIVNRKYKKCKVVNFKEIICNFCVLLKTMGIKTNELVKCIKNNITYLKNVGIVTGLISDANNFSASLALFGIDFFPFARTNEGDFITSLDSLLRDDEWEGPGTKTLLSPYNEQYI